MSATADVLVALVMVVGLAGVLVPVLPGLVLIWSAGVGWALLSGGGVARWAVVVLMSVLFAGGTIAKYLVPARRATTGGAPRSTLMVGAAGAVAGFFVIPVVGLVVGGLVGLYAAEHARLRDARAAGRSTRAVLVGIGIGTLVELAAGVTMVVVWAVGAVLI